MSEAVVRLLAPGDEDVFRALRIEALTRDAATFASDAGVEAGRPLEWFAGRIAEGVLGAFVDGELVGMAGYSRFTNPKQKHKATLWGMYLRADHRGSGLAGKLVAGVIEHARGEGAEMLLLAVNAGNTAAVRLYELAGFQRYGLEPDALKHPDGGYSDDALYALSLR